MLQRADRDHLEVTFYRVPKILPASEKGSEAPANQVKRDGYYKANAQKSSCFPKSAKNCGNGHDFVCGDELENVRYLVRGPGGGSKQQ